MGSVNKIKADDTKLTPWEIKAPIAKRDFIIRKIFINFLFAMNAAGLGVALYFVISYCPIPAKAFLISPFVVGVIGAVAYLKLPTFGISKHNYFNITNPAVHIGKALALAFFGPCVLANYFLDKTPYHDPETATCISEELRKLSFSEISEKHGRHFKNLYHYGFIQEAVMPQQSLQDLRQRLLPIERTIQRYEKTYKSVLDQRLGESESEEETPEWFERYLQCLDEKKAIEKEWLKEKSSMISHLPYPKLPAYDLSKWSDRIKVWARDFFLNTSEFLPKNRASNFGDLIA